MWGRRSGVDAAKLKPSELVQLINSTPLGTVLTPSMLTRQRGRAGFRIGDGRTINLVRYVAWLAGQVVQVPPAETLSGYDAMKERARARSEALSLSGRNIGELPAVVNPPRRAACRKTFRLFCETYFPQTFNLPWSDDHLKVIAKIEQAVLEGGLFAMAMPRGSGKTSLCEAACLWALLYGHREFVALVGADEDHAVHMLESIKTEIENNDLLLEDFPEVCYPVRSLEGIHQRAAGQLYQGKQTHIGWTEKEVVFPTIPGSKASGSVIRVAGLTGRIRGMKHKRVDGTSIRPSLVLVDDPQTEESAHSPSQCATREAILVGAILGLAGPGSKIAGLMPLTVIRADDMADRILDREKHPEWQGERTKMVYAFPANEKLWQEYAQMRRDDLAAERGSERCTTFYRKHQRAMDAGAIVAWPERHYPDELSAIQHAMNLRIDRGDPTFFAEYQNEPVGDTQDDASEITADAIAKKTNGCPRGQVPSGVNRLTMFIDVQASLLYWAVCGWEDDFTGHVVDYGAYPDQGRHYFTLRDAKKTLAIVHRGAGIEGALYAGLKTIAEKLLGKNWPRDDGSVLRIERCLIDANWGEQTQLVYRFCRESLYAAIVTPSHGRFIGASSMPMSDWKRQQGDRCGLNWRMPVAARRGIRHVVFDANYWKSFINARLATAMGDHGCLALFGRDIEAHRCFADQATSERGIPVSARGRTVTEWKIKQPGLDNHWLDCLVGCAVGASMLGLKLLGEPDEPARKRRKLTLAEWRAKRGAVRAVVK